MLLCSLFSFVILNLFELSLRFVKFVFRFVLYLQLFSFFLSVVIVFLFEVVVCLVPFFSLCFFSCLCSCFHNLIFSLFFCFVLSLLSCSMSCFHCDTLFSSFFSFLSFEFVLTLLWLWSWIGLMIWPKQSEKKRQRENDSEANTTTKKHEKVQYSKWQQQTTNNKQRNSLHWKNFEIKQQTLNESKHSNCWKMTTWKIVCLYVKHNNKKKKNIVCSKTTNNNESETKWKETRYERRNNEEKTKTKIIWNFDNHSMQNNEQKSTLYKLQMEICITCNYTADSYTSITMEVKAKNRKSFCKCFSCTCWTWLSIIDVCLFFCLLLFLLLFQSFSSLAFTSS